MYVNNKYKKGSKLVWSIANNLEVLRFTSNDQNYYDDFDLYTNFSVIVPFQQYNIFVEVFDLDHNQKLYLNFKGISNRSDLEFSLNTHDMSSCVSVGELTLYNNIIVNYNEHLRMSLYDDILDNPINDSTKFNLRELDKICSIALKRYLCNRIYVLREDFYVDGGLGLYW